MGCARHSGSKCRTCAQVAVSAAELTLAKTCSGVCMRDAGRMEANTAALREKLPLRVSVGRSESVRP